MDGKANIVGIIIKAKKIWWVKINRKIVRKSPLDGATFPYLVKIKYKTELSVDGRFLLLWATAILFPIW